MFFKSGALCFFLSYLLTISHLLAGNKQTCVVKKNRDFSTNDKLRLSWALADSSKLTKFKRIDPAHADSLAIPVDFPQKTVLWLERKISLTAQKFRNPKGALIHSSLSYQVYIPGEATGRIQSALLLKDKDGLFYSAVCPSPLRPGKWNTVKINLSDNSIELKPDNSTIPWSLQKLATISYIGFSFWSDKSFRSDIYLDEITTYPALELPVYTKFSLTNLKLPSSQKKIRQYDKFELSFSLSCPIFNPYDQDEVYINAYFTPPKSEQKIIVPAFYYQKFLRLKKTPADRYAPIEAPYFMIRFTPRLSGIYTYYLKAWRRDPTQPENKPDIYISNQYSFKVEQSDQPGFVQIAKTDSRYFEFENGKFFFPVGHNFRSPMDMRDWQTIMRKQGPKPVDRGLNIYEEYLPKIAANKENIIEVWMSSWWLALEWTSQWKGYQGLGRYNLENAWKLDSLIESCRKYGVYLLLVIDNHGKASGKITQKVKMNMPKNKGKDQVDHEWEFSPYNRINRGFLSRPQEIFQLTPQVKKHYRNILRYIAARWGYSTTILGLEMWSELDLTGDIIGRNPKIYKNQAVRNWHKYMTNYLRSQDHGKHIITTHYSGDYKWIDQKMIAMPEIDFIVCDAYHAPKNQPLINLLAATDTFTRKYRKPYWITEFGGNWNAGTTVELEGDLHAGLWSSWLSNAAGTGLFWWFEQIERKNLYHHFKALALYIDGEDKRRSSFARQLRPATILLELPEGQKRNLAIMSLGDKNIIYLWLYDFVAMQKIPAMKQAVSHNKVKIIVKGLQPGKYIFETWDTWKGGRISTKTLTSINGELVIKLLPFTLDQAFKIKRLSQKTSLINSAKSKKK